MNSMGPSHALPYAVPQMVPPAAAANDPLGIEKPPSTARKFVEGLLYVTTLNSAFANVTGIGTLRFVGGGLLLASGLLTLFIIAFQRERLTMSWLFALVIVAGANFSQFVRGELPLIGAGLAGFTHWLSHLLMMCYLVRNSASQKRVLLFSSILVIVLIAVGGAEHRGDERLMLAGVGSSFANANRLSLACGLFAVAVLFWSLRCAKTLRPVLWVVALLLIFFLFQTVSRSGLLALACGLAVLVGAILAGRGVRLGGIVLIGVGLVAASQLGFLFAESVQSFERRFATQTQRTQVYRASTLTELRETMLLGHGPGHLMRSAGITAHNTFLYLHTCYGGVIAYTYLLWIIVLSIRVARMMFARDHPMDTKLLVLALFGMGLAAQVTGNFGPVFYSTIYATAVVEKYTAPYSRGRIAERKALSRQTALVPAAYSAGAQPLYR